MRLRVVGLGGLAGVSVERVEGVRHRHTLPASNVNHSSELG